MTHTPVMFVESLRFLAAGQDDPHSIAISQAADLIAQQQAELEAERDEVALKSACIAGQAETIARLSADARRYRWLRSRLWIRTMRSVAGSLRPAP